MSVCRHRRQRLLVQAVGELRALHQNELVWKPDHVRKESDAGDLCRNTINQTLPDCCKAWGAMLAFQPFCKRPTIHEQVSCQQFETVESGGGTDRCNRHNGISAQGRWFLLNKNIQEAHQKYGKTYSNCTTWPSTDLCFDLREHGFDVCVKLFSEVRVLAHVHVSIVEDLLDAALKIFKL